MASTSDDRLLLAHLADGADLCEKHWYPRFIGFLDERQRGVVATHLKYFPSVTPRFWGGFPEGERTVLGLFPEDFEVDEALFPIVPLTFRYRDTASLSHRDFLGTVLGTGIRREKIGDILCTPGRTVVFVYEDVALFLLQQIEKVGGEGVTVTEGLDADFQVERQYKELRSTVASPRLDNVVKALLGCSREKAAGTIMSGLVSLDHQPCQSVAKTVTDGALLSIRGAGRFRIVSLETHTKRDRIVCIAEKYL